MTQRTYDMTGWTDRKIEEGDRVEPGWYHTKISDVIEDFDNNSITLEHTIVGGQYEGKKINDRMGDPDDPSISAAGQNVRRQLQFIRAKRLGLLPPEDQRNGMVTIDWLQALGRECYLKIQARAYKKADGTPGTATEPTFDGIFAPDDDRVPEPAKRHEPCGLDVLSEADQKRAAEKAAAKEQKGAEKAEAKKPSGGGGRRRATAGAGASGSGGAAGASQTDFGDI